MTKIFSEEHTLLEGVSLIYSRDRYDFAHIPASGDISHARTIDPERIPNAEARFDRFCEKSKAELEKASKDIFGRTSKLETIQNNIIKGLSGAVDKEFPDAMTLEQGKSIAEKYSLEGLMDRIRSEPLLTKRNNPTLPFKL